MLELGFRDSSSITLEMELECSLCNEDRYSRYTYLQTQYIALVFDDGLLLSILTFYSPICTIISGLLLGNINIIQSVSTLLP